MANDKVILRYNIVVLGDPYCGKTSLIERFAKNHYQPSYTQTIGSEFYKKEVAIDGCTVLLYIFDTAGQENMHTVIKSIYRKAQGILLVFDLSRRKTLDHIHEWVSLIKSNCESMPEMVLVGNKLDLDLSKSRRAIPKQTAREVAMTHSMKYFEVSAKRDYKVNDAFEELARSIHSTHKQQNSTGLGNSIHLHAKEERKRCCET